MHNNNNSYANNNVKCSGGDRKLKIVPSVKLYIVTNLIKALPGNGSVNTS
jgi:hypothetical protein